MVHPPRLSNPRRLALWLSALLLSSGCGGDSEVPEVPDSGPSLDYSGSWNPSSNFGGPWGHDRNPLISDHFMIFSGYASTEARQLVADIAEESLAENLDAFSISTASFDWLPGWEPQKIHILALAEQDFRQNAGFAYRDGLVIISTEHDNYQNFGFDEAAYKRLIKHESFHVIEFLLIGDPQYQQASEVWLREGMAQYVSRPRADEITTREQLEDWQAEHAGLSGGGNPISIHVWSDFPQEILDAGQTFSYYKVFELAVRYLVDPAGGGVPLESFVDYYNSLGAGRSLEGSFQLYMGMALEDFEADFWQLMYQYLDATAGT